MMNLETNSTLAEAATGAQWLMIVEWRYIQCGRLDDPTLKTWTQVLYQIPKISNQKKFKMKHQPKKKIYIFLVYRTTTSAFCSFAAASLT